MLRMYVGYCLCRVVVKGRVMLIMEVVVSSFFNIW